MRKLPVTTSTTARLYALLLAAPLLLVAPACTDLDEVPVSYITPDNFFKNEGEVISALAGVYAQLRPTLWSYYNLSQVSSDENIVPTRGQDWYDNGVWLELDKHEWAPNSPSGRDNINGGWVDPFIGVARANAFLEAFEAVTLANKAAIEAEVRTLRAFYYYQLMDLFGGVPLVEDTELKTRPRNTRIEIFDFIESELKAARVALPLNRPAETEWGRVRRGVADAILANLYLNAGVFRKDPTTVSATAYNSCATVTIGGTTACQLAINYSDSILNSGVYQLAANWRSNFTADNSSSKENIFVVNSLNAADLGINFLYRALHYNQLSPTPWNGFATIAEVYNAFDPADQRRQIFLVGQQINFDTGQPVNDRAGNPLIFTVSIANERAASEAEGARIAKWPSDPNHVNQEHGNDFAYFRLAEIYLIKAEAQLALGNTAGMSLLNTLRGRVSAPTLSGTLTQDMILQERLFELTGEAKRRQDLIRHGKFTAAWRFKPASQQFKTLMPIPQNQIDANPQLDQNPGYQ